MTDAEHEYVEYQLHIENGEVVACEPFGEGRQAEPMTSVKVYKPAGENITDHFIERLERRLTRSLSNLESE